MIMSKNRIVGICQFIILRMQNANGVSNKKMENVIES